MSELTTTQRDRMRDSSFAYIDGAGERHLPINDARHVRNAIARFGQTDFESAKARYSAAKRIIAAARRYEIQVDRESEVGTAARS